MRERILALTRIAAANESTISLEELRLLLPTGSFGDIASLDTYLRTDLLLSRALVIQEGEVTLASTPALILQRRAQRELTSTRLAMADSFVDRLSQSCPWIRLAAVSGSTAFGGAKPHDDVDFFLVTCPGRMWITLLVGMLEAKLDRMRQPGSPVLCFNRMTEEGPCLDSFREARDPLFAREALNLRIIRGHGFYKQLLLRSDWMADHFPDLYRERREEDPQDDPPHARARSLHWSLANNIAFVLLGTYLALVGLVRNARLDREGRRTAHFRTVIERSFCAFESRKYEELGDAYRRAV